MTAVLRDSGREDDELLEERTETEDNDEEENVDVDIQLSFDSSPLHLHGVPTSFQFISTSRLKG